MDISCIDVLNYNDFYVLHALLKQNVTATTDCIPFSGLFVRVV